MAGYTSNGDGTYSVNYEDERFKNVTNEQAQKEAETSKMYDSMINNSNQYYQNQIDAAQNYAKQQTEMQNAQTDFAIDQINQQKEQTQKDYIKEQKGAYADYQKESNRYGVNAEQMAASGLSNTGYSESSKVSMYNTYQNRVASARDTFNLAVQNYNNQMQQARLANNEATAKIAYDALQTQLKLSQQAFEYNNTLVLQKEESLQRLNEMYYARFQDVLSQVNNEIELQMKIDEIDREYERWAKEFDLQVQQIKEKHNQWQQEFDLKHQELEMQQRETDARIANIRASTAYTQAQSRALSTSSNPYSDSSSSNTLSENAQKFYNDWQEGNRKNNWSGNITSENGKKRFAEITVNGINQLYNSGKITSRDVELLLNKFGIS